MAISSILFWGAGSRNLFSRDQLIYFPLKAIILQKLLGITSAPFGPRELIHDLDPVSLAMPAEARPARPAGFKPAASITATFQFLPEILASRAAK